jgi:hypothetical protein
MPEYYDQNLTEITLHAAPHYPDNPEQLRGMTIAGLRIIQNSRVLGPIEMRSDVFRFLLSPKALSYWKSNEWIEPKGRSEFIRLTSGIKGGLSVCSKSLSGNAATNTSEQIVNLWIQRMLTGDFLASETKVFQLPLIRA